VQGLWNEKLVLKNRLTTMGRYKMVMMMLALTRHPVFSRLPFLYGMGSHWMSTRRLSYQVVEAQQAPLSEAQVNVFMISRCDPHPFE
jgi:hypothetical protein